MRALVRALLLLASALLGVAQAQSAAPLKTRNVVLIVSDGLRWQEIFTGADSTLLNEKYGGIWDKAADLKREFWRADPNERRKALFPFLWTTVATRGQIYGNQTKGSIARVTNGLAFSYPGYNEMTTGHPDARINSNEFGPNPNISVFEWLNGLPDLHGRVAVYATWNTFKDIFNVARSKLPLVVGWDPPYQGELAPPQALLNRLYATTTRFDNEDVFNAFLQVQLLESFAKNQPRVLFVGYGETDNWAHQGRYDLVLHSAHAFDQFVEELWNTLQGRPEYKDQTTLSSPPIMVAAAVSPNGRSTVWKKKARKMSGSRSSARTPRRSGNAATPRKYTRLRLPQPSPRSWVATTAKRFRQPQHPWPRSSARGRERLLRPDRRRRAPLAAVKAAPDCLKPQGGACRAPRVRQRAAAPDALRSNAGVPGPPRQGNQMQTRRDLLKIATGATASAVLPARRAEARPALLILGGTGFIGPNLTQEALERGWQVTHFNRGKTAANGVPNVETLIGDRKGKLDALRARKWDAMIDDTGYVPKFVRMSPSCSPRRWVIACSSRASPPMQASPNPTMNTRRPQNSATPTQRKSPATLTVR